VSIYTKGERNSEKTKKDKRQLIKDLTNLASLSSSQA
jgi:phenylpyruvate tautomerase PptA (4-oxalocrotonate tautomerase family)